jgi:ADP-heptose:LPS heptosyltransferase
MIWLQPQIIQKANRWCASLKRRGTRRIIAVNLGVGGNPRKTLGDEFEFRLLESLLQKPGTLLLLDQGFGEDEQHHTTCLIDAIKKTGIPVHKTTFDRCQNVKIEEGLIGLKTQIGEIAAILSQCDEYIGYDSAGQHIAAAVGTPCLTIFAGSNNMRFIRRWRAYGPECCRMVHVDTLSNPGAISIDDIILRILNERDRRHK